MKKLANIASRFAPILTIIFLLLLWEAGVRKFNIPDWLLPGPWQVLKVTVSESNLLYNHTIVTVYEAMIGFALSIIIALITAFILDNIAVLKRAIYPLLTVSQTIPLIILAILLPLWLGWGLLPKVLIVILVCFFPIIISLLKGLDSVDPDLINLFRSFGAGRLLTFKIVKLPAAMPSFFSGLRISATYSFMAAVIAEWVGAQQGLGYFMTIQQKNFNIAMVLAAVFIISLLSLLLVKLVDCAEYFLIPWNRKNITLVSDRNTYYKED